jgi:hypothetical protein
MEVLLVSYGVFSLDGKLVQKGEFDSLSIGNINLKSSLLSGYYLVSVKTTIGTKLFNIIKI